MTKTNVVRALRGAGLILFSSLICNESSAQLNWNTDGAGTSTAPTLWLEAGNGLGFSSGSSVSSWTDARSSGVSITDGGDSSHDPSRVTGALNGLPVLRFNGTSDVLFNDSVSSSSLFNAGAATIFIVQTFNGDVINDQSVSFSWKHVSPLPKGEVVINAPYQGQIAFTDGSSPDTDFIQASVPGGYQGSAHLIVAQRDGSSPSIYIDGSPFVTTPPFDPTHTLPNVSGALSVGAQRQPQEVNPNQQNFFFNGDIAEVLVFSSALDNAQYTAVEQYLGNKYGLSVVPEPAQYATAFAGVCLGCAMFKRLRRAAKPSASC
jgi:hypothetical protein